MSTMVRTAVCVLRVWMEGDPPQLRGRLTTRLDVTRDAERVTVAVGADVIAEAVRDWLDEVVAGGDTGVTRT